MSHLIQPPTIVWPIIQQDEVFHIGTLDPNMKFKTHNATSLEGNGLSVSVDPDAWRSIARLSEHPTWSMTCRPAACFVDIHALTEAHWTNVLGWATDNGLVSPTEAIEVSWYDSEADQRVFTLFDATKPREAERAQAEYEDLVDSESEMKTSFSWMATPEMNERIGFKVDLGLVKDLALTMYCEDVLFDREGVHGVWWEDDLNPGAYSAPRGVIHARALPRWTSECIDGPKRERAKSN